MTVADPIQQITVNVGEMNCASCVASVQKAAKRLPGVESCDVSLARGRATVAFDATKTSPDSIAAAIEKAGYTARVNDGDAQASAGEDHSKHADSWRNRAIAGLILWLPVETLHWIHHLTSPHAMHGMMSWIEWLAVITSTIAIVYVGSAFYRSAWNALLHRTSNMDTLIAMGASTAYGYSLIALVGYLAGAWHMLPDLYFMEAAGLLALISLGHALEARARTAAGDSIKRLLDLTPATAWRLPKAGGEPTEQVPVADVHVGDRLLIAPGRSRAD